MSRTESKKERRIVSITISQSVTQMLESVKSRKELLGDLEAEIFQFAHTIENTVAAKLDEFQMRLSSIAAGQMEDEGRSTIPFPNQEDPSYQPRAGA